MTIPADQWLDVVIYRDFYDLPRLILAGSQGSTFWILDSEFDPEADEYQDYYSVYAAGRDLVQAKECFDRHAAGARGERLDIVSTSRLLFDPTKRKELMVSSVLPASSEQGAVRES